MNDGAWGNTNGHNRRSIRLKGYDYSQPGAYFVTICTQNRECLFGEIENGVMRLNAMGEMAWRAWEDLPRWFNGIAVEPFVIMPNHMHGVITITDVGAGFTPAQDDDVARERATARERAAARERAGARPAPTRHAPTIGEIVGAYKSLVVRDCLKIYKGRNQFMGPVWQRNYWEHIIRDEKSYEQIAAYILNNPQQWEADQLFPEGRT